jgi:hypothetical protein
MMFTLEVYKRDGRTKSGERFIGKYDFDRKDREAMLRESNEIYYLYHPDQGYRCEIHETYVTRTNMMGGAEYQERYDTPRHCSPSSEAYWSM